MASRTNELPIHAVRGVLLQGLSAQGRVVLSAPTGSGKSTQVPQILLDEAGLSGEIIVLQPRRLATRMLARRVASERDGVVGGEVGYQIRFENRSGPETRIRFVTEAILLRRILSDPALAGVGAIVFDEFHERHLVGDLALACALRSQRGPRPDLKLVVMSATLEVDALASYLAPAARVEASGRTYPVEVGYAGASLGRDAAPVWERAAAAFRRAAREGIEGDVLVFMPGAFEIRRTIEAIEALPEARGLEVLPLHGELPPEAQDRAVAPSERRRVIVSTNVAETSLTIEGVRTVIDGGLARIARYDPRRGINALLVEPISRASADQRAGRAGRTGPGRCIRLWSEAEQGARAAHELPEVKRVDLSESLLLLAAAGETRPAAFPWFEAPEAKSLERASMLLRDLGATTPEGGVTELGRTMARFPLHPRFARILIEGHAEGVLEEIALLAALSQGRAFYRASPDRRVREAQIRQIEEQVEDGSDFFVHLRAWKLAREAGFRREDCEALGIHGLAAHQAGEAADQFLRLAGSLGSAGAGHAGLSPGDRIRRCLLVAFADHIALRNDRGTRRCRMVHGRGGELRRESVVESPLFVAAEIEEREVRGEVTVLLGLATAVELSWLEEFFPTDFNRGSRTFYDPATRRVVARSELCFRDLVIEAKEGGAPDAGRAAALLAAEVLAGNLILKEWTQEAEQWIARVNFVARHCPETGIAAIDEEARQLLVEQICAGAVGYKEIKDRPVLPVLRQWISPEEQYYVDRFAPAEFALPGRKRPARIRYGADGRAILSSKLQDFYDLPGKELRVADGKVPLVLEMLAPNGRPAHLTDDLDGFWGGAYAHVRKDLAGRYPKHEWR